MKKAVKRTTCLRFYANGELETKNTPTFKPALANPVFI